MNNQVVAVARETKLLVGLESTAGVQLSPTASGVRLVLTAGAGSVQQAIRHIDDPQYRNTRSQLAPIIGSFDVGKWSMPTLLKSVAGSGTPAVPEIDPFLQALMGIASVTSQTAWFGANSRAYLLKGVDISGTIYPSLTMWFRVGHMAYYICGATVNQGEFNVAGNELSKVSFSGEFMRHGFCGTDAVSGLDTGSGTSLRVEDPRKFFLADTADRLYIAFVDPSSGTVGNTAVVTAIDYDTNTLTLASGVTRTVGHLVAPYLEGNTTTELGTPCYGKYGVTRIGGTASTRTQAALPQTPTVIQSARITVVNGIKYHADLKDDRLYPTVFVAPGKREVTGELTMLAYRDLPVYMYKALRDPLYNDYVILPTHDRSASDGRVIELHCPAVLWGSASTSGEDEKSATIPFKATASPSYDDEFAIVYGKDPSSTVTSSTTSTS